MTGEISLGGVYLPSLLLIAALALMATGVLSTFLQLTGFYRYVAFRPVVDICLFVLLFGLGATLFLSTGS
ncbi:DUF1656 domain-containing protein [Paraburkholderia sacchari]|uniref:DUF1656 domain-containing protein n=1 Tax=Paraburkholderia sacchari TaxID=159450 RepID=UPI003D974DAF